MPSSSAPPSDEWCHFCETTVTPPHECDEARWSKLVTRYEFNYGNSPYGGPSMDPDEHGDYVSWEDAVKLLRAEGAAVEKAMLAACERKIEFLDAMGSDLPGGKPAVAALRNLAAEIRRGERSEGGGDGDR